MKVYLLRSPESEGRPEKWIMDAIEREINKTLGDFSAINVRGNSESEPKNGKDFYDESVLVSVFQNYLNVINSLEDFDILFFADAQMAVIPMFKYILTLKNLKVKMVGIFHSSSETRGDLFYGDSTFYSIERATLKCLDAVFCATQYLARNLYAIDHSSSNKFFVTGLPVSFIPRVELKDINLFERRGIAFPHRISSEKGFIRLLELGSQTDFGTITVLSPSEISFEKFRRLRDNKIDLKICSSKEDYFNQLKTFKGVLSLATLETFGYASLEGVMCGCRPIFPKEASYREMYSEASFFKRDDDILSKISDLLIRDKAEGYEHYLSDFTKNLINNPPESVIVGILKDL
jgi:hypothetical protein